MVSNVGGTYKTSAINTRLVKTQVALKNCSATESIQDTDNDWAITRYAYDPYGNQVTENRLGNSDLVTNTDFDSTYHLFPTRRYRTVGATAYDETAFYYGINPASGDPALSDTRAHWGALAEWCGVNEVCSRYAYDDYGRVNRQWDGEITNESWNGVNDNLDATAAVMWTYNMSGTVDSVNNVTFKRNVIEEWHAPRCYGNFSRKVYDGLGQLIQVQGPQQDWTTNRNGCNLTNNGKEVDVSYTYDALGNQTRAGVPVATTANYVNRAENWGAGYTATTYDALGRPKTVTAPNGEVQQYDYVGRAWALIGLGRNGDSNKYLKWQENDALGNLKSVATWYWGLSGQTYTWLVEGQVTLAYDVIGNLTDVFHPTGQTTHMEYDLGGRKSNMNDPDLGYWVYVYDRQHKLTQQTDARGCTTTLLYDTLGRLTTKQLRKPEYTACQALAAADADVTYGYDSGHSSTNRSRGQLTSINNPSYAKGISYNATGLLVREEVWISGVSQNVVTLYDYDAYRRPTRITYPDNEYTTTTYNGMGLPNSLYTNALGTTNDGFLVDGITSGGDTTNGANYDEAGRLRNLRFPAPLGSNLWQSYYYFPWTLSPWNAADGNSNGRLWYIGLSTSVNGNERMLLDYRYDSFGNVRQYSANEGGWQTFGYDYQNRLIEANSAVNGPEYTYDAAGRLTGYETTTYTGYRGHGITTYGGTQRYYYDANGNVVNRRWGLGNQQALTWDLENRLSQVTGGNGYAETYLYDADGQRVKKSNGFGGVTYYVNPHYEMTNETVWVDDALPGGASVVGDSDGWTWESGNPASGTAYHRSATLAGTHQHYFYDAKETLKLSSGDVLYAYVYLDPASPPQEVMLQWYDTAGSWEHRAYWGQNQISFGTDGTNSRRYIGALPATGGWVRLEVPAAQVGLVGQTVTGMAYTLYGGRAWWDRAGARHAALRVTKNYHFNGQLIAQRKNGVLSYLHGDHLSSTMLTTNGSGTTTGDHRYYPYGRRRDGAELGTESRFTGQKLDGTGLQYFNSRYYDPELGTFISPDTLVPDPTNLFDYNRYMYVRGNPLKYNDPTGHDPCGPGANPHCAEYLQGLTTSGCQGNCGVSYDQFLTAKQQYADYKADPEQYAVDQQTLNGDVVGDVEAAKTRLSYGLLYASYFAHKNPDVDITMQASVDVLLASMSIISGNAKDAITSNYYRSGKPYSTKELNEAGATRLRRDPADVKSDGFADFIRSKTGSFRAREWEKVMETWEYLDGRTIENHYWRNKKTGDTYHHE